MVYDRIEINEGLDEIAKILRAHSPDDEEYKNALGALCEIVKLVLSFI